MWCFKTCSFYQSLEDRQDPNLDPNPDPLSQDTDPRIWIRKKILRIRNAGCMRSEVQWPEIDYYSELAWSRTLLTTVHSISSWEFKKWEK
jgi:hypothetical protein